MFDFKIVKWKDLGSFFMDYCFSGYVSCIIVLCVFGGMMREKGIELILNVFKKLYFLGYII